MKRKCSMCRRMIELNASSRFVMHAWTIGGSRECPNSGAVHDGLRRDREWVRKEVEGS